MRQARQAVSRGRCPCNELITCNLENRRRRGLTGAVTSCRFWWLESPMLSRGQCRMSCVEDLCRQFRWFAGAIADIDNDGDRQVPRAPPNPPLATHWEARHGEHLRTSAFYRPPENSAPHAVSSEISPPQTSRRHHAHQHSEEYQAQPSRSGGRRPSSLGRAPGVTWMESQT